MKADTQNTLPPQANLANNPDNSPTSRPNDTTRLLPSEGNQGQRQPSALRHFLINRYCQQQTLSNTCCGIVVPGCLLTVLYDTINLNYSIGTSLIFASLTAENSSDPGSEAWYSACSFALNFPMSWVFFDKFWKLLKNISARTWSYKIAAIFGLAISLMTSIAAMAIGEDAIFKSQFPFVKATGYVGVAFFFFNTLSTRFGGATDIVHDLLFSIECCLWRYKKQHPVFFQLKKDIKNNLNISNNILSELPTPKVNSQNIKQIAEKFYQALKQQPKQKHSPCITYACRTISIVTNTVICWMAWATSPMWIAKASAGLNDIEHKVNGCVALPLTLTDYATNSSQITHCDLGNSSILVMLSAAASVLFYLASSISLIPTFSTVANSVLYPHYPAAKKQVLSCKTIVQSLGIVLIGIMAYYSGQGMGNEMSDLISSNHTNHTALYNFSPIGNNFYSSWLGKFSIAPFLSALSIITTFSAGLVVNYKAALCFTHIYLLQTSNKMITELENATYQADFWGLSKNNPQSNSIEKIRQEWQASYNGNPPDHYAALQQTPQKSNGTPPLATAP